MNEISEYNNVNLSLLSVGDDRIRLRSSTSLVILNGRALVRRFFERAFSGHEREPHSRIPRDVVRASARVLFEFSFPIPFRVYDRPKRTNNKQLDGLVHAVSFPETWTRPRIQNEFRGYARADHRVTSGHNPRDSGRGNYRLARGSAPPVFDYPSRPPPAVRRAEQVAAGVTPPPPERPFPCGWPDESCRSNRRRKRVCFERLNRTQHPSTTSSTCREKRTDSAFLKRRVVGELSSSVGRIRHVARITQSGDGQITTFIYFFFLRG